MDFEDFQVAILRRPANAPELDSEMLAVNKKAHKEYLTSLREAGIVVSNGGVRDHRDPSVKGMVIYAVGSIDEAMEFALQDPSVIEGRLAPEIHTWHLPAGTMRLSGIPAE